MKVIAFILLFPLSLFFVACGAVDDTPQREDCIARGGQVVENINGWYNGCLGVRP